MISIKIIEKDDDRECQFLMSYVFATSEDCIHSYVSYFQSLESTKIFCLQ